MTREFQERKQTAYPDTDPTEVEALRFTKGWHRYPGVHSAMWYKGINLGEMDDYVLLGKVLKILLEREGRIP